VLGVIGGSGLYELEGLTGTRWERVSSSFGEASDDILLGELDGAPIAFLPRHGRGHWIPPGEINSRANVDALKRAGVTDLVSVTAVGSLREEVVPGTLVLVNQFIDRTCHRAESFFGTGCVAHVGFADPVCGRLGAAVAGAADRLGMPLVRGATCVVMEGPAFSTRAESLLHRHWGADLIGMTALPEAKLAREAEICYAAVAMVTDFDCWHDTHADVSVADVLAVMAANVGRARALLREAAPELARHPSPCPQGCDRALDGAIITPPGFRDAAVTARLDAVAARALGRA
jgi:5'-methylthioadenosine phosphorylase